MCLLGRWCVLIGGRRDGLVYWAGTVILFAVEWLWVEPDPGWGAWIAGSTFAVSAACSIRHERDLVAQLSAAQAGLAERARAEERNRIARELHDVIAHTLTVSLLHVTSARLAVEHDLADAARCAGRGRAARPGEPGRGAVGRRDAAPSDAPRGLTAPLPGAAGLPALVEQFRSAGADVTLAVDGDTGAAARHCRPGRLPDPAGSTDQRDQARARRAGSGARRRSIHARVRADRRQRGPARHRHRVGRAEHARAGASRWAGTARPDPGGHGWLVRAAFPLDPARRAEDAT